MGTSKSMSLNENLNAKKKKLEKPVYVNMKTSNLDENRKGKLFKMYEESYKKIGTTFTKKQNMYNYYTNAIIFKNNKDANRGAILYWPNPKGKKVGLVFGTNSQFMKAVTIPTLKNLLETNGWYAELSDALEHILKKHYSLAPITNKDIIRRTIGVNNLNVKQNGSYERHIAGVGMHTKKLYGRPKKC